MAATPVRVDFTLRTSMVVSPTAKTLDAVLAWAAVRRADFAGSLDPWAVQHETGLARHEAHGAWCPMASILKIDWQSEPDQIHYIKRQSMQDYADAWMNKVIDKRPAVDTTRGDTKAGSYVQQTRWVKSISAWAMVDDMALFKSLLPWATHIGKLHHRDFGAVKSFEIVEDASATMLWADRPLPVDSEFASDNHVRVMGALHSPYWKRENHRVVLVPCD